MTTESNQDVVNRYFDAEAQYWRDVYGHLDLQGSIYLRRMQTALRWIRDTGLPPGARALEVGSGAGFLSAELARRGLQVTSTDSSPEMVELTRRQAAEFGVSDRVRALDADVHHLPFERDEFDLVVGLGLLPWVADPVRATSELVRVLKPGSWLLVTADNRGRLNLLVEPRENPVLAPIRLAQHVVREALGQQLQGAQSHRHLPSQVDRFLQTAGATPTRRTTLGFGPFTWFGRPVLTDQTGQRLQAHLDRAAEHRMPRLRRHGWHYVVAARKPVH